MTSTVSGPVQLSDKVWSWLPTEEIEPGTMTQIQNIAALPCTAHVAMMPDAHKGYGMPIGCALATRAAVVPYAVGVDIGCGMIAVKTSLGATWPRESIQAALVGIFARVPVGQPSKQNRNRGSFSDRQDSAVMREWISERGARDRDMVAIRERADRQVGTLGGGNHFIELQSDGTNLWLMLHTGSRAFGKYVCDWYHAIALRECERHYTPLPDKELAFMLLDSVDGKDYMLDMGFAMRFAEESRGRIKTQALDALTETFGAFDVHETIETHHNFAAVEQHMGMPLVVHRKGAVRTTNRPLVTIPGSMQTGSYIGRGIPNVRALDTCSHGAGRRLGRNQTRRDNVGVDIKAEMAAEGIELVCPPDSDALDEAGRAYKDIENVMRYQADLVEPVVKLAPLGVVKG